MSAAKKLGMLLTALCLLLACLPALGESAPEEAAAVDYAAQVQLNLSSGTQKLEATVKTFVDGDTTHFWVSHQDFPDGVLKARYLAIDTPESTGKIEEYGKRAASYTRERLSLATSIIIESDDQHWNPDSTGSRYMVWVWYKTADMAAYRNLNIELLQQGLAIASSAAQNRYGDVCMDAIAQARAAKLAVYSGQKDPDFYYGSAIELTLRALRADPEAYTGKKVAFEGVITMNDGGSVYLEDYDPETGLYFGLPVYYGYNLSAQGLDILSVGNRARIVGTLQYYEAGESYQVSGLTYRMMKPKDPGNIQKISQGHSPAYVLTDPALFVKGLMSLETEEGAIQYPYAWLTLATSIEMQGLTVQGAVVTETGEHQGAMTLSCQADGLPVQVRLAPMRDQKGALLGPETYLGKTLDVQGIVDYFDGVYQIKVLSPKGITLHPVNE